PPAATHTFPKQPPAVTHAFPKQPPAVTHTFPKQPPAVAQPPQQQLPPPPPLPLPPPPPLSYPPTPREAALPPPPPLPEKLEPPIVTLDDLFRKTRTTPRIYYLPLSEEQVAAKLKGLQVLRLGIKCWSRDGGSGGRMLEPQSVAFIILGVGRAYV
ncbi:apoptotic chromatin condensation inducer in the nucleus-like protein, partial [Tanacetum coccineum]